MHLRYFASILLFLCSVVAEARDFGSYQGARMLGMGGAGVAVANDETSLLVNPNGLGRLRSPFLTFIDPEVTGNFAGLNPLVGTGGLDVFEPEAVYDELGDRTNEPFYFKGQVFPSLVFKNFGLGVLAKGEVLAQRKDDGTLDYNIQRDLQAVAGFNMSFFGGRMKVGFTGRGIRRREFFGNRDPQIESLNIDSFSTSGTGLAADGGLTLTAPWHWLPTVSAVVRDIGNTKFSGDNAAGVPQVVNQVVDVGVAAFPLLSNRSRATLTLDYRDVTNTDDDKTFSEKAHGGVEFNLWDLWFLRGGYGAGQWTAGLEYANSTFQWQLATYGEVVDFSGSNPKEDRRWVLKFSFRQ